MHWSAEIRFLGLAGIIFCVGGFAIMIYNRMKRRKPKTP